MNEIGLSQRIAEIGLALSMLFESPTVPSISDYEEGPTLFIRISWVVETHRDPSLNVRCVLTMRLSAQQIHRYATMGVAKRIVVCARLCQMARDRFLANQDPRQSQRGRFADLSVDDRLLEFGPPGHPSR